MQLNQTINQQIGKLLKDGNGMIALMKMLWPINRSITGSGLRETLKIIQDLIPDLVLYEVKSGTKVLDWEVPLEWEITKGILKDPEGHVIADFHENNLHVIGYSDAVDGEFNLEELFPHLYSLPNQPEAIPYVTSYYQKNWGFCISDIVKQKLKPGKYKALIESKHFSGSLTYGEFFVAGKSKKEVFISTYCCHPSMANNELSGPCLAVALIAWLKIQKALNYSYRFVFAPETIGSATYLEKNKEELMENVIAAFNLTCVGDEKAWSFLPSRLGNTYTDKVALHALKHNTTNFKEYTWSDRGSDEKMYCAPLIDLPMVSVMRSKHGSYPEYHTSLDVIGKVVTKKGMQESFDIHKNMINIIENDCIPISLIYGEPQLGRRGLYPMVSHNRSSESVRDRLDLISYADGKHTLLDIAELCQVDFLNLKKELDLLVSHQILDNWILWN